MDKKFKNWKIELKKVEEKPYAIYFAEGINQATGAISISQIQEE